ncbi:hypothetical protein SAMN00808754_1340 [Thermanaeromonas toyohensis ToBE]|uniref:Ribbon-helix-helix protein, copG family n=1 Tax=Thermanaeromonas toyohensis ToBE TaxID=698762 RepID=A0A1W1VR95_9FIRM|nr:hypothetical protein [Thermanaeromonas toyohensis]SMB95868.1 hypothetical protein SAMN00808754_1340 [Thermanaeromonas toyohensis ToBE]
MGNSSRLSKRLDLRVDEKLYNMLQAEAKRRCCPSVAALARKILEQYFAQQEEEAEN